MNPHRAKSPPRGYRRRRAGLNLDLNNDPPIENDGQEGGSTQNTLQGHSRHERQIRIPSPINVDDVDDDVIISSPRAFAEAKKKSRRTHSRAAVADIGSGERMPICVQSNHSKRRRVSPILNSEIYINLESSSNSTREAAPKSSPIREPTFSCPICMSPLEEEMSTKCGHIFCKACIKAAINAQGKCPTCRKVLTVKDLIRVYLPPAQVKL